MSPHPSGFRGRFAALLLPPIILQSVLIGGGYATGREIVEYGGRFGSAGWVAVAVIFAGFSITAFLTFEVARVFGAYSYKRFIRHLIGPLWPAFDVLYVAMATLVIAVMASAAGAIVEETLGLPALAGTAGVVVAVGVLIFYGSAVIEVFKTLGSTLLYGAYALFGILVLTARWDELWRAMGAGAGAGAAAGVGVEPGVAGGAGAAVESGIDAGLSAGVGAAALAGVLYVGYNLAVYPPVLFSLHRQTRRAETLVAGLLAGLLMTLPFAITYLCILSFYPDPAVLDAPVPWLPMLRDVGGGWPLVVFGIVVPWTLLETSVGMVHAVLERVDSDLESRGGPERRLTRGQHAALAVGMLLLALILARFGIIALVARGYTIMGYLFIALFGLPLLTIGAWKVFRRGNGGGFDPLRPPL